MVASASCDSEWNVEGLAVGHSTAFHCLSCSACVFNALVSVP